VNEILIGVHDCDKELLMAKVILIHKDKDTAILDYYRPIALLNTIYQLIMLIITMPPNTRVIQPLPSHTSSRTLEEDKKESGEKKQ